MTYCFTVYYLFKNCFDSTNIHTLSLVLIDNIILEFSKLAFQQTVDISLGTFYFLLKQISNFTLRWICEVLSLIYSHFSECLVESWSYGYDREKIFFFCYLYLCSWNWNSLTSFTKETISVFYPSQLIDILCTFSFSNLLLIPVYHKYGETGISKLKSQTIYLHLYFHYRCKFSKNPCEEDFSKL